MQNIKLTKTKKFRDNELIFKIDCENIEGKYISSNILNIEYDNHKLAKPIESFNSEYLDKIDSNFSKLINEYMVDFYSKHQKIKIYSKKLNIIVNQQLKSHGKFDVLINWIFTQTSTNQWSISITGSLGFDKIYKIPKTLKIKTKNIENFYTSCYLIDKSIKTDILYNKPCVVELEILTNIGTIKAYSHWTLNKLNEDYSKFNDNLWYVETTLLLNNKTLNHTLKGTYSNKLRFRKPIINKLMKSNNLDYWVFLIVENLQEILNNNVQL